MNSSIQAARQRELARFGYKEITSLANHEINLESEWEILKTDFLTHTKPTLPAFAELSALTKDTVLAYLLKRRAADNLMDQCDQIHLKVAQLGASKANVNDYILARDAFEDAVEDFGKAGVAVAKAFAHS